MSDATAHKHEGSAIAGSRETLAPVMRDPSPGNHIPSSGTEGSVVATRTWNRVSQEQVQEHGNAVDATDNNKNLHPPLGPRVRVQVLERRPTPQAELFDQLLEAHAARDIQRRRPAARHREGARSRGRGVHVGAGVQ